MLCTGLTDCVAGNCAMHEFVSLFCYHYYYEHPIWVQECVGDGDGDGSGRDRSGRGRHTYGVSQPGADGER